MQPRTRRKARLRSWKSGRRSSKENKSAIKDKSITAKNRETQIKIEKVPEATVPAVKSTLSAAGRRFAIVVSRFNEFITERLLQSATDGLLRLGAKKSEIDLARVPGAFEIPSAARSLAETGKYDAIICIGCLLRGDTLHYDVIANEVTRGIGQSAQETGVPHAFGVLTCDTLEQAIDRAGLKSGNKGFEAALAAVEMANLGKAISGQSSFASQVVSRQSPVVSKKARSRRSSVVNKKALSSQHSAVGKKKQIPRSARNDKHKNVRRQPR
ncbi:MAG TPA: 6,7-dimethyl-8-ribityllumazine synthase [Terriglobales bacterium]